MKNLSDELNNLNYLAERLKVLLEFTSEKAFRLEESSGAKNESILPVLVGSEMACEVFVQVEHSIKQLSDLVCKL